MEDLLTNGSIADFGVMGLFMFMCFQYIIKPIIASILEKRKGNNPSPEVHQILEILSKRDSKDRPLVWGYCQKEAIEELTKAIRDLTEKLK